jgi:hypothetical protein
MSLSFGLAEDKGTYKQPPLELTGDRQATLSLHLQDYTTDMNTPLHRALPRPSPLP